MFVIGKTAFILKHLFLKKEAEAQEEEEEEEEKRRT